MEPSWTRGETSSNTITSHKVTERERIPYTLLYTTTAAVLCLGFSHIITVAFKGVNRALHLPPATNKAVSQQQLFGAEILRVLTAAWRAADLTQVCLLRASHRAEYSLWNVICLTAAELNLQWGRARVLPELQLWTKASHAPVCATILIRALTRAVVSEQNNDIFVVSNRNTCFIRGVYFFFHHRKDRTSLVLLLPGAWYLLVSRGLKHARDSGLDTQGGKRPSISWLHAGVIHNVNTTDAREPWREQGCLLTLCWQLSAEFAWGFILGKTTSTAGARPTPHQRISWICLRGF